MTVQTGTVVDARDGKIYKTVLMPDGKWWAAENLAYVGSLSWDYSNNPSNRSKYGRLYTWQSAQDHCPVGCHIPSISEWNLLTGSITAPDSVKLKSQSDWEESGNGTDIFGFNAKGGGIYNGVGFFNLGYDCDFWTNELQTIGQPLGPAHARSIYFSGDDVYETTFQATQAISVRFIIDSGNIPDHEGPSFLGAPISGLERGYSVSIDRHVTAREAIGGGVRLIPRASAQSDAWTVDAEVLLTAAQAGPFEAAVGAYGSDSTGILNLPARGGASTFAGLAPAVAGADADTYIITAMRNPDAMGRRAVAVDLFAYRVQFDLIGSENAPIALTSTVPDWLPKKFATHALRDSSQWNVYASPSTGFPIHPAAKVRHGRGQGHTITLDALDDSQADHLVAWYRNSRSAPVTITIDRGIAGQGAVSVYLVDLSLARDVGLHWSGSLEVVEA